MNSLSRLGLFVAGCAFSASLSAHHSASLFAPEAIWIAGKVVEIRPMFPHATIILEQTTADGQMVRWTVEGRSPGRRGSAGVQPEPGDVIEVCGFPLRASDRPADAPRDPYRLSGEFVHGHLLKMPDGHLQQFGGYGQLDLCVRVDDSIAMWTDFLNSRAMVSSAWCRQLKLDTPRNAPPAMIDEITRGMELPCTDGGR